MMSRTHVVLGVSAGALCALAVHPWVPPGMGLLCIPIAAVMGPAADVDHHAAPARAVAVVIAVGLALYWWPIVALYAVPLLYRLGRRIVYGPRPTALEQRWRRFWRHREGTHRITTALGVGAATAAALWFTPPPLSTYAWMFGAAVTAGWLSHIYGDARTHSGVPIGDRDGVTIGYTVRTGSTRADARRARENETLTEEHLYYARYRPCALALSAAALAAPVLPALFAALFAMLVNAVGAM